MDHREPSVRTKQGHHLLAFLLLVAIAVVLVSILVLPHPFEATTLALKEGQVASEDISAPYAATYVSDVRTENARAVAERNVSPQFSLPDPSITRKQINVLRKLLDEVELARTRNDLSVAEKTELLVSTVGVLLEDRSIEQLLMFSDVRWQSVRIEALRVLEVVMRSSVRDENLEIKMVSLPQEVSLALTEDQASAVVALVTPYIVPNSFFNPQQTDLARQNARANISPVSQTYVRGELIVQRGRILGASDIEALEFFSLIASQNDLEKAISASAIVSALTTLAGFYFIRRKPAFYYDKRSLFLIGCLLLLFTLAGRWVIPDRVVLPYVLPLPAFGLLIATLFGSGAGMIFSIILALVAPFGLNHTPGLAEFYLFSSLVGVLALGKGYRIGSFVWAGLFGSLAGIVIIIAYRLPSGMLDWVGFATLAGASLLNGVASASLALLMQYFLADIFGLATGLRLLEISRSDAPLLKHFLRTAPGTYQHSLMVANLVEQAGEKLKLDTLLLRVGALYHDIGKTANAAFFIENQLPTNLDPHDDMPALDVAKIVIRHVADGKELAHKYRLPNRILDFILEHHGTLTAKYLYNRALAECKGDTNKVDISAYKYPGPSPKTKETGLMMLADNVEARTRSERPKTEEEIASVVRKAIESCQADGQLANTPFTFRDLAEINEAFVTTLIGLYHPRIAYPNNEQIARTEDKEASN